jgi:putative hydrolase of the HAD superfamily
MYFDLGNVLIFFSYPKMVAQVAACTGLETSEIERLFFDRRLREVYETGQMGSEELVSHFRTISPRKFSFSEFMHAFSDIFTPNQELWPVVDQLKSQGVRLILLSNTSECHFQRILKDYPICQKFDHSILSYEVGACKPDALIYERALAVSGCKPEECFYIDDIPEFIKGAETAGLPGEIYTSVPALHKQLKERGCTIL